MKYVVFCWIMNVKLRWLLNCVAESELPKQQLWKQLLGCQCWHRWYLFQTCFDVHTYLSSILIELYTWICFFNCWVANFPTPGGVFFQQTTPGLLTHDVVEKPWYLLRHFKHFHGHQGSTLPTRRAKSAGEGLAIKDRILVQRWIFFLINEWSMINDDQCCYMLLHFWSNVFVNYVWYFAHRTRLCPLPCHYILYYGSLICCRYCLKIWYLVSEIGILRPQNRFTLLY